MTERVEAYFGELEELSGEDLDRSARNLVCLEKQHVARLIAHLSEISKRKLHLEWGYKDLFDYGVRALGLSEGSVWRRLQVANVCRRFPQVLVALWENRLNVTTASLLAPHLSEENAERLLSESEGKSKREIQELVVRLRPKESFKSSVRKQSVPMAETTEGEREREESGASEGSEEDRRPVSSAGGEPRRSQTIFEPASEEAYNFRFAAGKAFREKFERFAEVMGIEYPHKHVERVLDEALEIALEKKDPKRKHERRLKREGRRPPAPRPGEVTETTRSDTFRPSAAATIA